MIVIILLHFQLIISNSNGQSYCTHKNPFRILDGECSTFEYACYKTDDPQCEDLKTACKNCPPSNITLTTLKHILNINQNQFQSANKMINLAQEIKNIVDGKNENYISVGIIVIINIIFLILVIIIVILKRRFRIFGFRASRGRNKNTELFKEIKINNEKDEKFQAIINENTLLLHEIKERNNEKDEKFQAIINENTLLLREIKERNNEKEISALESVVSYKLRFQIANQFDETELFVSKFDNVIKLKKSICDRNMNMNDYKRMIMKYKGVTLDNNQYLLSCIDSTNIPIFCEFDNNVDANAMIVIKLKCDNIYPEMLQIWKLQQIKDLKIIISELNKTNYKDLLIVYKSTQLDDDKTIDYYKIEDNDWIQIVNKSEEMKNITMKSIFTDKETISIEFSKFETVSDIIDRSIQKIQPKITTNYYFVVFLNKKVMQNDKFIYEYNIDSKSLVEFCYFKNVNEINELVIPDDYGHIKMGEAKNKITKRPVLIKAYKREYMDIENDNDLSRVLREDLQIFQLTKFHPRFIQLFDIYLDNDFVYIELEDMRKGLMKKFLSNKKKKKKGNEISIYDISKWAYQILEGLKYLHNHNIILKDMNPMNIWIDENFDIKLTSFNTTEYLNHLNDVNKNKYIYGVDQYKPNILTYVAPEILESEPYDASVDVWSLGVIMIDIITGKVLYFGHSDSQVVNIIKESRTIEYDKTNKPKDLTDFIDCCVKGDPKERAKINDLMKMEFIKKYLL